ncbi:uncharacterized protein LOC109504706 [Harpegnathos saltator]|uniref:uncharacterized protein LOC109504706 n=1 Tax=Harpegnathos saltator TaxID=610380 RepID=UPI000948CFB1|nr:uncharacterized protein LOC109504706 [Harpegnathos saltator]
MRSPYVHAWIRSLTTLSCDSFRTFVGVRPHRPSSRSHLDNAIGLDGVTHRWHRSIRLVTKRRSLVDRGHDESSCIHVLRRLETRIEASIDARIDRGRDETHTALDCTKQTSDVSRFARGSSRRSHLASSRRSPRKARTEEERTLTRRAPTTSSYIHQFIADLRTHPHTHTHTRMSCARAGTRTRTRARGSDRKKSETKPVRFRENVIVEGMREMQPTAGEEVRGIRNGMN